MGNSLNTVSAMLWRRHILRSPSVGARSVCQWVSSDPWHKMESDKTFSTRSFISDAAWVQVQSDCFIIILHQSQLPTTTSFWREIKKGIPAGTGIWRHSVVNFYLNFELTWISKKASTSTPYAYWVNDTSSHSFTDRSALCGCCGQYYASNFNFPGRVSWNIFLAWVNLWADTSF